MEEKNNNRNRWLHLRLTKPEQDQIQKEMMGSTCRKLSDYARRKLLDKPVTIQYRNQSQELILEELSRLRTGLNSAGNNFNQAVKKLNSLGRITDFSHWLISYDLDKRELLKQVQQITIFIENFPENGSRDSHR